MTATKKRLITAAEYWKMADRGELAWRRCELINGTIWDWPPRSNYHCGARSMAEDAIEEIFDLNCFWVRSLGTLDLDAESVVDPDLSVVSGSVRYWSTQSNVPRTALLVVEISDSSLEFDRTRKASLYAASGIADYWILNLVDRQLEIRRDPQPDATQEFGAGYASLVTLKPGQFASPLAKPDGKVAVSDLLPN